MSKFQQPTLQRRSMSSSPRLWPNPPSNSPLPLPKSPILFTNNEILELDFPDMPKGASINLEGLREYIGEFRLNNGKFLREIMDFSNSKPMLIAGELANPYRLCDIMVGNMPIIPVRLENICRTYADNLDSREITPGIHHITIARSIGWWESSFITLVDLSTMKKMVSWLDNNNPSTWAPKRLAEGTVRLENDMMIMAPRIEDVSWDGDEESINCNMPSANGPAIDLSSLIVPINTRQGCYNHRGRIVKCRHHPQTEFHENLFRRGSSFKWDQILTYL